MGSILELWDITGLIQMLVRGAACNVRPRLAVQSVPINHQSHPTTTLVIAQHKHPKLWP